MRTLALFECNCGTTVKRPRGKEGHPECLFCHAMTFIKDVEVSNYE